MERMVSRIFIVGNLGEKSGKIKGENSMKIIQNVLMQHIHDYPVHFLSDANKDDFAKKKAEEEAAAKKKKRFGGYAPASRPSGTAASSSKSASPVKGLGDSMKAALKRKVTAKNEEIKRSRESSKPTSPRDAAGDKPAADVQQIGASLNLQKVEPSPPVS